VWVRVWITKETLHTEQPKRVSGYMKNGKWISDKKGKIKKTTQTFCSAHLSLLPILGGKNYLKVNQSMASAEEQN
jgi:hypothetical protein